LEKRNACRLTGALVRAKEVEAMKGDCIGHGFGHDPCRPWPSLCVPLDSPGSLGDNVAVIEAGLVVQGGRKENYRAWSRWRHSGPAACRRASGIHEGMARGAVARTRTPAIEPARRPGTISQRFVRLPTTRRARPGCRRRGDQKLDGHSGFRVPRQWRRAFSEAWQGYSMTGRI
jgi:hypothetical protein